MVAAQCAASQPACPAPTTITSYFVNISIVSRETKLIQKRLFTLCFT